jgi:hypothetical protein
MDASQVDCHALEEVLREQRNILGPFAQCRHANHYGAHAKIKVAAELLVANQLTQIGMTGGDQPNVELTLLHISQPSKLLLFQDFQQLWLNLEIHVANLIEENRPSLRNFQKSKLSLQSAGECASFVAKKFAFEELSPEAGAVQIYEWFLSSRAAVVNPPRQNSLSRAGFSGNKHWTMTAAYSFCFLCYLPNRGTHTYKRVDGFPLLLCFANKLLLMIPLIF